MANEFTITGIDRVEIDFVDPAAITPGRIAFAAIIRMRTGDMVGPEVKLFSSAVFDPDHTWSQIERSIADRILELCEALRGLTKDRLLADFAAARSPETPGG